MSIHLNFSKNSPKYRYNEIVEKVIHKFLNVKLVNLLRNNKHGKTRPTSLAKNIVITRIVITRFHCTVSVLGI